MTFGEVPLVNLQKELGGNLGEFGGWVTSMDYGNPVEEHLSTRTSVSVFDVSHMGRYVVKGGDVYDFFQKAVSKDLRKFRQGTMSGPVLLLNDAGGIKDDIMLYYLRDDEWLVVVNAPNVVKDREWLLNLKERFGFTDIEIEDITKETVLVAIQGPKAPEVMESLGATSEVKNMKILEFIPEAEILGSQATLISRSGWTGEEVRSYGFEVWTSIEHGAKIFREAVKAGAKPAGLIARDSLRLEMGYLLSGVDMDESTNPIEVRYWLPLTLGKTECVGCEAVMKKYEEGVEKVRIGFKLKKGDRSIPRHGNKIYAGSNEIGYVTSGVYSPMLKRGIGMGYVKATHAYVGYKLQVEIRGKLHEAKILEFPLI
ncbi:MAG: glycine cleavage system aminomethyltransferase GcvT [Desulfurococcales archaeon]|nr:glycine cleavage system aminomethyltransferase GcvT [Desulfurococcales archaeon]